MRSVTSPGNKTKVVATLAALVMPLFAVELCGASELSKQAAVLYVSPNGNDTASGTENEPLLTLEAARDRLRNLPASERAGATVLLQPGLYIRHDSFELTKADSGSAGSPVVYKSSVAGGARIIMAVPVRAEAFKPVTESDILERLDPAARNKVVWADLGAVGARSTGPYPAVFTDTGGLLQVFFNNNRLPISRWPADGYTTMDGVLDSGFDPVIKGGTFKYRTDRPSRWQKSLESGGVWLKGFWRVPWVIQAIKVQSIDTQNKTITHAAGVPNGIGSKYTPLVNGTRKGDGKEPWFAMNLIEEISVPGHWAVDFSTKRLYLWPPGPLADGTVTLADVRRPVIQMNAASHITLEGISVEQGLSHGISINKSSHITLAGCNILASAEIGIDVSTGSTNVLIDSCNVSQSGSQGVRFDGGDRKSLTPSNSRMVNTHVSHTGQINRTVYGVEVHGVGVHIVNNLVHDTPLGGIEFKGNDHIFELNEIHNTGLDGGDLGGIYTNGDWAGRGNIIRHNLIHHGPGTNAIYLDDGHSGTTVIGNIAYKVRSGPFVGGGHDHVIQNNLVVDCEYGLHIDDRGIARGYTIDSKGALTRFLNTYDLTKDPWKSKYPDLIAMLSRPEKLPIPTGNNITQNAIVNCKKPEFLSADPKSLVESTLKPNVIASTDVLSGVNVSKIDFSNLSAAPIAQTLPDLKTIPVSQIGLFTNDLRPVLPTAEQTGRYTARQPRRVFDTNVDIDQTNQNAK